MKLPAWIQKILDAIRRKPEPKPPVVPPVTPPVEPPGGHSIPTVKVDGDGLWKPDTLTYIFPRTQRAAAPAPGWTANGKAIRAEHIGRAEVVAPDGTRRGFLLWPGGTPHAGKPVDGAHVLNPGTGTAENYFGDAVKLSKARIRADGDKIRVFDVYGQTLTELPVPEMIKRAEGRR